MDTFLGALLICVYLIPSFVAAARRHPYTTTYFFANLFFGWTVVGWILILMWVLEDGEG